jgi:hypothetical protein
LGSQQRRDANLKKLHKAIATEYNLEQYVKENGDKSPNQGTNNANVKSAIN